MILVLLFLIVGVVLFSPFAFIIQLAENRRAAKAAQVMEVIET